MTRPNNLECVLKWRAANHELHMQRQRKYANKIYAFKRQQRILFNIDITFFD